MKRNKAALFVAAILNGLVALPALAQTTSLGQITQAAQRSGDLSRQAMVSVFGNVVNNPLATGGAGGGDTILASLFQVTNGGLLVVGAFFACYTWFKKLSQAAHSGSVYGPDRGTMWGPIRLVWGLASLVPTANGWAMSQLLMLWAASIMGIGIANMGTDAAIQAFNDGKGMVLQPAMPSTINLSRDLYQANLCMHTWNAGLAALAAGSGAAVDPKEYVQLTYSSQGFVLRNQRNTKFCGGADIDAANLTPQNQSTNWFSGTIDTTALYQAHLQALKSMESVLSPAAQAFVNAVTLWQTAGDGSVTIPDAEVAIQSAAQSYEATVQAQAATTTGNISSLASQLSTSIKDAGWWSLGAWYQTFASANSKLTDAVAAVAHVYKEQVTANDGISTLRELVYNQFQLQEASSEASQPLGTNTNTGDGNAAEKDSRKALSQIFSGFGQKVIAAMTSSGDAERGVVNPLIQMKNLGDATLGGVEAAFGTWVFTNAIVAGADASIWGKVANIASGLGAAAGAALRATEPMLFMLFAPLLLLGAGLSLYLPMIPFITWFGAIINWLVIVGEAIVAAPLWAMTHLGGEGDGMGQRTTHGYIFLLNVMVRPILMVVGFFFGGAVLVAGGTVLTKFFGIAVANAQFDSLTGIVSVIGYLAIYFTLGMNLVHTSFSLILIVPDQVINWVGGLASPTLGREAASEMRGSLAVISGKLERLMPGAPKRNPAKGESRPSETDGIHS
ncbi:DotA/TraY family protein (plasmid) [Burkholderia multivorans]|uniref:DotA/TraY family protein n=1 Tax=Burkholderia multivorans TaxID=87883 RepID=UPI0020191BE8|nr:DotA/TraY family protein [Burkholderia multivorans]MCO1374703.1 DotA/TraY family protein [Burkholderia multivorans]MCO1459997.1 DotA/TraY family protein [Burkholderia multivorans]MCO1470781.1 DotA/TraY family protein [Burkholderia multivorans]UQO21367.1 DotA/TraY family protein [Burkholderia multivorans]UQO87507.1 DotA/TraY family protein [Burkholderia multivorans]